MKKNKILLLIIICIMLLSGCNYKDNENSYSYEKVVADLSEKYHEQFEYLGDYSDPFGSNYDSFWITSKDQTSIAYDRKIYVEVKKFKSKDRVVYDKYLSIKFEEETKEFFKKQVEKKFSHGAIIFNGNRVESWLKELNMTTGLDYNTTFGDYLKHVNLTILALVKESDFKDLSQMEEVINSVSAYSNNLIFDIWVIKDDYYRPDFFSNNYSSSYIICKIKGNIINGDVSIEYN